MLKPMSLLLSGLLWLVLPMLAMARQPTGVIVESVQSETFVDRLEAVGTLRANESVTISAIVTEQVSYIGFDDGERVTRGQVLVRFEAREEGARIEEAKTSERIAREEMDRAQRLYDRGALSESVLQTRRRDLALAESQVQTASVQGSDRVIRAPFDGVVGLRQISVGATVRPGDPIVRIDQVDTLNLDFPIPETRLPAIAEGQTIMARASARPGQDFEGTITTLDSFIDPVTRSVLVRAELDNSDGLLRPGMLMTVEIESAPRQALLINEGAIVPFGETVSVYKVTRRNGQEIAERTLVQLGTRRPGQVEIISGVSAGDLIITHGTMKISDGQAVRSVTVQPGENALARYLEITAG
ncbi:MAG: efflux RND transporter periplasmic adaptor subunit [Pseudomonadota bacterium]